MARLATSAANDDMGQGGHFTNLLEGDTEKVATNYSQEHAGMAAPGYKTWGGQPDFVFTFVGVGVAKLQ